MHPLPKSIFEAAINANVHTIILNWSGGSDEGYLNIDIQQLPESMKPLDDLEERIQEWAEEAFEYSGAGDGNSYGDDYTYDLCQKTVTWGVKSRRF